MSKSNNLRGVIAASPTPVSENLEPDIASFVALCEWLLENGCDAVNICGTTGEATSLSLEQRLALMDAAAKRLPLSRLMAGTGAASVADAVRLTEHAAALGLAGALLIPPFYFKNVSDDGVVAYFEAVVAATTNNPIDLYLYNVPQFSSVEYTRPLVEHLRKEFGSRIAGLKDSSAKPGYAEDIATISADFAVFPSSEASLLDARAGKYAGCISGSANITSKYCARAYHDGDKAALKTACAIRDLASRAPLIPSVKAVLSAWRKEPALARLLPPLTPLSEGDKRKLVEEIAAISDELAPA